MCLKQNLLLIQLNGAKMSREFPETLLRMYVCIYTLHANSSNLQYSGQFYHEHVRVQTISVEMS